MATTPSHPAPAVGGAARWTSRLLSAAEGGIRAPPDRARRPDGRGTLDPQLGQ
jgi:hypothetical protein